MNLFFSHLNTDGSVIPYIYPIPELLHLQLQQSFGLSPDKTYMFTFGRFVHFDPQIHGQALTYVLSQPLNQQSINQDLAHEYVTYVLVNAEEVKTHLSLEQILFVIAILHQLDLKPHLVAITSLIVGQSDWMLGTIKMLCRTDQFKLQLYEQPM